jgi:hypothetical protein
MKKVLKNATIFSGRENFWKNSEAEEKKCKLRIGGVKKWDN